jgi:hypothetical protein
MMKRDAEAGIIKGGLARTIAGCSRDWDSLAGSVITNNSRQPLLLLKNSPYPIITSYGRLSVLPDFLQTIFSCRRLLCNLSESTFTPIDSPAVILPRAVRDDIWITDDKRAKKMFEDS